MVYYKRKDKEVLFFIFGERKRERERIDWRSGGAEYGITCRV